MLDLGAIFLEDRAQPRLIEHQALEPLGVFARPEVPLRVDVSLADQETVQTLAGPLEIYRGAFPAGGQLPVGLLGRIGGKDLRQLPGGELRQQLAGIAPVRLDPISRLTPNQRGSDDLADTPQLLQPTLEHKPAHPRLIADVDLAGGLLADPLDHPLDLPRRVGHREFLDLSRVRMYPGDLMLFLVGVQGDMRYI